jgi:hypothetical protein
MFLLASLVPEKEIMSSKDNDSLRPFFTNSCDVAHRNYSIYNTPSMMFAKT